MGSKRIGLARFKALTGARSVFARGYESTRPSVLTKWPAPAAALGTGALTITIAQVLTGVLEEDPAHASSAVWTLPTAALAVAGVEDVAIGDCIDFVVINNASVGDNEVITITEGSGATVVGNVKVAGPNITEDQENSGSAMFRIRFTGVASGSEAYVLYRIA